MNPSYEFLDPNTIALLTEEALAHGQWHIVATMRLFSTIYTDKTAPRRPAYEAELRAAYKQLYAATEQGKAKALALQVRKAALAEERRLKKEETARVLLPKKKWRIPL
mgnify:CR=1 FL=1